MTDKQIDELLALEANATPGPWFEQYEYDGSRTVAQMRSTDTTMCVNRACHVDGNPWEKTKENATLIAAARNNLRPLCEEVKRLREALEKIESTILTNSVEWRATSEALNIAREALNK